MINFIIFLVAVCLSSGLYWMLMYWAMGGFEPKNEALEKSFQRWENGDARRDITEAMTKHYAKIDDDPNLDLFDFKPDRPIGNMENNRFAIDEYTAKLVAFGAVIGDRSNKTKQTEGSE